MSVDAQWLSRFPVLSQFPVPRRLPQMLGAPHDVDTAIWTGSTHSTSLRWFSAGHHGESLRWEIWQRLLQHPLVMQRLVPQVSLHPTLGDELSLLIDGTQRVASLIPLQPPTAWARESDPVWVANTAGYLDGAAADVAGDDWQRFLRTIAGSPRAHRRADRLASWLSLQARRLSRLH